MKDVDVKQNNPTPEQLFRDSLEDSIVILKKLAPRCDSVSELVEMASLALTNAGQLRLLMGEVAPVQMRSQN